MAGNRKIKDKTKRVETSMYYQGKDILLSHSLQKFFVQRKPKSTLNQYIIMKSTIDFCLEYSVEKWEKHAKHEERKSFDKVFIKIHAWQLISDVIS